MYTMQSQKYLNPAFQLSLLWILNWVFFFFAGTRQRERVRLPDCRNERIPKQNHRHIWQAMIATEACNKPRFQTLNHSASYRTIWIRIRKWCLSSLTIERSLGFLTFGNYYLASVTELTHYLSWKWT